MGSPQGSKRENRKNKTGFSVRDTRTPGGIGGVPSLVGANRPLALPSRVCYASLVATRRSRGYPYATTRSCGRKCATLLYQAESLSRQNYNIFIRKNEQVYGNECCAWSDTCGWNVNSAFFHARLLVSVSVHRF